MADSGREEGGEWEWDRCESVADFDRSVCRSRYRFRVVADSFRAVYSYDEVFSTPTATDDSTFSLANHYPKPSRSPVLLNLPSSIPEESSYFDDRRQPSDAHSQQPTFSSIAELSSQSRSNPVRRGSMSRRMERSSSSSSSIASTSSRASITSLMLLDGAGHPRHSDIDDAPPRSTHGKERMTSELAREENQETITKRRRGRISQSAVDLKDAFGEVV